MFEYVTEPCAELRYMKGLAVPADVKFRQILLTGPPGAGKSTLIRQLGGWSEEGYLDISRERWWTDQALAVRPREIHLGLPFKGFKEALAVFDPVWVQRSKSHPRLDAQRIRVPPPKRHFLSVDWRSRYVFEFLLPPVDVLLEQRKHRALRGTHPVDNHMSRELVTAQLEVFYRTAVHLSRTGLRVYVRQGIDGLPVYVKDAESTDG